MPISKKDRDDYKQGRKDSKLNWFDKAVTDITANHPGTKPYYQGRAGKPLDEGKRNKKDK